MTVPRIRRHYPLLLEVMATLGRIKVREGFIKADTPGEQVHGMARGQDIYVNPVWSVIDTVIHEVLHVLKPEWSEKTIRQQTSRLCNLLTEEEARRIWNVYRDKIA